MRGLGGVIPGERLHLAAAAAAPLLGQEAQVAVAGRLELQAGPEAAGGGGRGVRRAEAGQGTARRLFGCTLARCTCCRIPGGCTGWLGRRWLMHGARCRGALHRCQRCRHHARVLCPRQATCGRPAATHPLWGGGMQCPLAAHLAVRHLELLPPLPKRPKQAVARHMRRQTRCLSTPLQSAASHPSSLRHRLAVQFIVNVA